SARLALLRVARGRALPGDGRLVVVGALPRLRGPDRHAHLPRATAGGLRGWIRSRAPLGLFHPDGGRLACRPGEGTRGRACDDPADAAWTRGARPSPAEAVAAPGRR